MLLKKIYGITALAFLLVLPGCLNLKEPEFREVKSFRLGKIDLSETTAKMDLVFHNPNSVSFQVKATNFDVYINNTLAGHSSSDTTIRVPGNADFVVPVTARVNLSTVFSNALTALLAKEVNIKISGSIKVGKAGLNKTFPVNYEGKQTIQF